MKILIAKIGEHVTYGTTLQDDEDPIVPEGIEYDRYQVFTQEPSGEWVVEDSWEALEGFEEIE